MANLKDVIYLSNSDYATLVSTGTVTINGTTLTYDDNNVYITPEEGENFNVINASDIVSNTLTQAQYDLITNGKPTLIIGTLSSMNNPLVLCCNQVSSNQTSGVVFGMLNSGTPQEKAFYINITTKVITFYSAGTHVIAYPNVSEVNGKSIPAYPSSPASAQVLTYGTSNTLSWTSKLTLYRHRVSFNSGALIVDFYVTYATPISSVSDVYQLFSDSLCVKDSVGDIKYIGINALSSKLYYVDVTGAITDDEYTTFGSDTVTEL